ncbi:hypothetical protein O3Q52_38005 [Streptomyces sp. ActVer]|uniref:hypothetical protein n=1 Tax=Streptomyces sp. ActVer TaxID=3014558 RepID=UPI0022B336BD|nr:hypothetical protein [Streptomyces sp. ActVer]MCZ4513833.1 hypothetical protein [Streptomyces sp. ActVer]
MFAPDTNTLVAGFPKPKQHTPYPYDIYNALRDQAGEVRRPLVDPRLLFPPVPSRSRGESPAQNSRRLAGYMTLGN